MRTESASEPRSMSYAGAWRQKGTLVVHTIFIAPDASWLGTEQIRDMKPDGDRLTLYGTARVGLPRRRVLERSRCHG
jgi:Lipocalin-like domain